MATGAVHRQKEICSIALPPPNIKKNNQKYIRIFPTFAGCLFFLEAEEQHVKKISAAAPTTGNWPKAKIHTERAKIHPETEAAQGKDFN